MSFFVYGRDAKTGEVVKRFFSAAPIEAQARKDAESHGIEVTAVVRCRADERPGAAIASERVDSGVMDLSARTATAEPRPESASAEPDSVESEMTAFNHELEAYTPEVYVTYILMGVNALVFLAMVASGQSFLDPKVSSLLSWGAEYGPQTTDGQWWRLFTAMFVHIGFFHLLSNMLVFAYVGPIVERMTGNLGFLLLYIVAGLGGGLLSLLWNPLVLHAGASGAIFGVYSGLLGLLLRQHGTIPPHAVKSLRNFVLIFVAYNLISSLRPGIGMAAHLGGLATGFVCGLMLGQPYTSETPARRPLRNVVVATLALVMLGCGIVGTQARYPRLALLQELLDRFDAFDHKINKKYEDARWHMKDVALSKLDQARADLIESELLPQWRGMRAEVDNLAPVSPVYRDDVVAIRDYMRLRQEGWELLVAALRRDDKDIRDRSAKNDKVDEADKKLSSAMDRRWVASNHGLLSRIY